MIHLDTSFLIRALVQGSAEDRRLRDWLRRGLRPSRGRHLDLVGRVVSERVPFLEEDALLSVRLFNESGRRRGSLMDCMIAASALRAAAKLATANVSDFRRFAAHGLALLEV